MKKVSIVMPAYNASRFITESVNSVQNQTYNNWEIIIVNDASTDDTQYKLE
ncbi:glycosyltransferase, partial [Enterococcus faecium]|nr:glycosyltransferase [Enterococcus faecium]